MIAVCWQTSEFGPTNSVLYGALFTSEVGITLYSSRVRAAGHWVAAGLPALNSAGQTLFTTPRRVRPCTSALVPYTSVRYFGMENGRSDLSLTSVPLFSSMGELMMQGGGGSVIPIVASQKARVSEPACGSIGVMG